MSEAGSQDSPAKKLAHAASLITATVTGTEDTATPAQLPLDESKCTSIQENAVKGGSISKAQSSNLSWLSPAHAAGASGSAGSDHGTSW